MKPLVGAFKTVPKKKINLLRHTEGKIVRHRYYYEHFIRNQQALERTWLYIESNPARWETDDDNTVQR